jgi:hypothetical protein
MVVSSADLDPRVTALAKSRSSCTSKVQTRPLVREGAKKRKRKIWSLVPDWRPTPRHTGRLTISRNLTSTSNQFLISIE